MFSRRALLALPALAWSFTRPAWARTGARKTEVSIKGRGFLVDGRPTYEGRKWNGVDIQGLLLNSRMVQGIFDDENPATRSNWAYPDGPYDAGRNTRQFVAAMPQWRKAGLIAFTINLQGGSPYGYSRGGQGWINSAFDFQTGALKPAYMVRLERILDRADALGMVPILGFFYFGQSPKFASEQAVIAAVDAATDWVLAKGYRNVVIEIANECNVGNHPPILKPDRAPEMIQRVQQRSLGKVRSPARRLLVSTSYGGDTVPGNNVAAVADFFLVHGNGVKDPARITEMVAQTRALPAYRDQPILFNEDDHFDFDKPSNNFIAAVKAGAGWGYYDYRMKDEGFEQGYQSVPADWGIASDRKKGFFKLVSEITGS